MKRFLAAGMAIILLLPLWGCGGRELYERLLIHGIGVDVGESGFVVTVRSSISPEEEEYFRCEGRSVLEAMNSLSRSTGRQPFYAHNYLVVFGRACAEQGLDCCLDFFVRYYNTRPAVRMYLAEQRAEDILSFQKDGKYLKMGELQQLSDSSMDTGCTVGVEILDFVNGRKRQGSAPVLPVLRRTEEAVEVVSTACFDGDTLRDTLTLSETRGYLSVKGRLRSGEAVVSGSFGRATLSFSGGSGKVTVEQESPLPAFHIAVMLSADVSALDDASAELNENACREMEAALADTLQREIEGAIDKAVRKDRCDIFGFGALLRRTDPQRWEAVADDWNGQMARCVYTVEVTADVARLEQGQ